MDQKPTQPPKRPPPKNPNIPPVVEKFDSKVRIVDPYRGLGSGVPVKPFKRHPTPSELDITQARHDEQIKGLDRRVETLEEIAGSMDSKVDKLIDSFNEEKKSRELERAAREYDKTQQDHKTKRFQALLAALPLLLAPLLGFFGVYMGKDTVSQYTKDAQECEKHRSSRSAFIQCIRDAQVKNTPDLPPD